MKRLMTLMLALTFMANVVAVSFAQDTKKEESTGKKKSKTKGKKKKEGETKKG